MILSHSDHLILQDFDEKQLPLSYMATMGGHDRAVSALAWDKSGNRPITGSYDYKFNIYEFSSMNEGMRPNRFKEADEGHQIRHIRYNNRCDALLLITGSARPKIFDREGRETHYFCRGNMYLHDLKNTKGHVNGTRGGVWHPFDRDTFLSCGEDGTLRVWNTDMLKKNRQVIKLKSGGGGRTPVTACCYSGNGKFIVGGGFDGSLQLWGTSGPTSRPKLMVRRAHQNQADVTCVQFASDDVTLYSRSTDGTMKVWDARKFQSPLAECNTLPCTYPESDLALSPDEQYIIAGMLTNHYCLNNLGLYFYILCFCSALIIWYD